MTEKSPQVKMLNVWQDTSDNNAELRVVPGIQFYCLYKSENQPVLQI